MEDGAKRKKDSCTRTTVWGLLGEGDIRGLNGNGENIKIKPKRWHTRRKSDILKSLVNMS